MLENRRLLSALACQPVDRPPVWIMRQAGRYLPEYRALRQKAKDFLVLCKTPELACALTFQPIQRYPLDAAIIFSDILMIPDAMRLGLQFIPGRGPVFRKTIQTQRDVENLPIPDPEESLGYVMEAIRLSKKALDNKVPLIGFAGSPFTVSTYMVEGGTSKHFTKIKKMLYSNPKLLNHLLSILTKSTILYLQAQIKAGVDAIMLFDTWGGILSKKDYLDFSLKYMTQIITELKKLDSSIPVVIFTKNGGKHLVEISQAGCAGVGLDWTADLKKSREHLGDNVAIQGNLDPSVLYASDKKIESQVKDIVTLDATRSGYIFNLGHGIHPDVNPEKVLVMLSAVHKYGVKK